MYLKTLNSFSNVKNAYRSSKVVRQEFINYFVNTNGHSFIKSSPVVPFCDPTVAFVNAGMNQFKNIFLGKLSPSCERAANSQKCVRVGGKHNDLSIVGSDGYHHTFFEMLGNWSFGDYFKKDACTMAWNLLTNVYGIDPRRLYVTYFSGSEKLNIPADEECRNIWREIGLPDDRIIPFGVKDNFWEMGATGPCGPCTEIHIDRLPVNSTSRAEHVNTDSPDLVELWNIVFIQYNRVADGSVTQLPTNHIDTGMGFERLVSVLQSTDCNYGTDLFMPIFDGISKVTKCASYSHTYHPTNTSYSLDTAYRVMADHSRMITVCLADKMYPEQNHKLRRILRKCLLLSQQTFRNPNLLYDTIPIVVDILGETYSEMQTNYKQIIEIIKHEDEVFDALRQSSRKEVDLILRECPQLEELELIASPGFVLGYNELRKFKSNQTKLTTNEIIFKLYDTYGLDMDSIRVLTKALDIKYSEREFDESMNVARNRTKSTFANIDSNRNTKVNFIEKFSNMKLPKTNDESKYDYVYDNASATFKIPSTTSSIIAILDAGFNCVDQLSVEATSTSPFYIMTGKTGFYCEAGGQASDSGKLLINGVEHEVLSVLNIDGYILHLVNALSNAVVHLGEAVELMVDEYSRSQLINNHTGVHLLNAGTKSILNCAVYQKSSNVTKTGFKLELGILGAKLDLETITEIENLIRNIIRKCHPIKKYEINSNDLMKLDDVTLVPGEVYPSNHIKIIEIIDPSLCFISREPCCGTHAVNTNDIQDFCITNVKLSTKGSYIIEGVAGEKAVTNNLYGSKVNSELVQIQQSIETGSNKVDQLDAHILYIKELLTDDGNVDSQLPYNIKKMCTDLLALINKLIKDKSKGDLKNFIETEMKQIVAETSNDLFIVHILKCPDQGDSVPLQKATKSCTDRPILVLSFSKGIVKARCCVPEAYQNTKFNAGKWMEVISHVLKSEFDAPKGQNIEEVCNLKGKKVKPSLVNEKLEEAVRKANDFALKYVVKN